MKKTARTNKFQGRRPAWLRHAVELILAVGTGLATAADSEVDPALSFEGPEDAGNNWVEFGLGGMSASGNRAQAEQWRRVSENVFGGIEDLHFQKDIAKATVFTLDGRGIYDENDYRFGLGVKKEETYFVRIDLENHRSYSNADGGYHSPSGTYYPYSDEALTLDYGKIAFEAGLSLKDLPALLFKYTHLERDGEKGSTVWGPANPGLTFPTAGLVPAVQAVDDSRHIIELDATYQFKATLFGLGGLYEFGDLESTRKMTQYPGEPPVAGVAQDRKITNQEKTSYDVFNVHAFSETWVKPNLFFSAGYMYSDLDNDTVGNRVWGDDFGVVFVPDAANGQGYTNLVGTARKQDHVANMNLMSLLTRTLTFTPSLRVQRQDWDAQSSAASTFGTTSFGSTASDTDADAIDVRERLDLRYTGVTNWIFTAYGEWTQGEGDRRESGGLFNAATTPGTTVQRDTEETRFVQKYGLGAKWYATRKLHFGLGGYYKLNEYDYDHLVDSTPNDTGANRYPAFLTMQDFSTYDGNLRLTYRPHRSLSLVTGYDYQSSTINTTPDPISGLSEAESADMVSHFFAQNVSWTPWSRLYLQAGFNYVISELQTPTSDYTAAVLDSQNNYWNLHFNAGFVLTDQTDLNLGYSYYRADNYTDNAPVGVPYGSGDEEHGVTAAIVHRLTANLRATLRYGFYHYTDDSAGGFRDYEAHVIHTGLQYRF
jgi:hypothetical protein